MNYHHTLGLGHDLMVTWINVACWRYMIWEHLLACCRKFMQTRPVINALSYSNRKMNRSSFPKTTGLNTLRTRGTLVIVFLLSAANWGFYKVHTVLLLNSLPNKSRILESPVYLRNMSSTRRSIKMALICCLESWLACKYFSSIVVDIYFDIATDFIPSFIWV